MQSNKRASFGFYSLGALGLGLSLLHLATENEGLGTVLEAFILISLSGVILYTGYDLRTHTLTDLGVNRILYMTVLSVLAFALLALAIVFIWRIEGNRVSDPAFMVLFAGILGGAFGGRATKYAVKTGEDSVRIQNLTKLLKVNQRVLRHNLRNELAIALGHLENVADETESADADIQKIRRHLEELLNLSDESRKIVSIWETDERITASLEDLVDGPVRRFGREYPEISIETDLQGNHAVRCHPDLPAAIEAALENAVVHNNEEVEITIESPPGLERGHVSLSISDTGRGIPANERMALFQPEETPLSHGEGLGLWLIYWAVKRSDGQLEIDSNEPSGTVVRFLLPPANSG